MLPGNEESEAFDSDIADDTVMDHGAMIIDELSFIQLMIPHHQEAVDTTTELLKTTSDTQLQTL